jgi:transcriptional regulator with XRE-family HTH domain
MDDDWAGERGDQASLFPKSAGDRLREAREAQDLTLADIATRTRVPMRHLEAIENGNLEGIPSPTYAIGFARSYARVVGLDEKAIAAEIRQNPQLRFAPSTDYVAYEPRDPKRLPSRGLATTAGAIGLLVLLVVVVWFGTSLFRHSDETPVAAPDENIIAAAPEATPTPAAPAGGQVTLVATGSVWLKVHDAAGKTLFEKTLAPGERYDVPADANGPLIDVGRPDQLQVTINGSQVAPLGGGTPIKNVAISAAALQARGTAQPGAQPTPAPAATRAPAVPPVFAPPAATPTRRPALSAPVPAEPTPEPTAALPPAP